LFRLDSPRTIHSFWSFYEKGQLKPPILIKRKELKKMETATHHISPDAKIGNKTKIWQFVIILPEANIGDECNICSHVFIENKVVIGNKVTIKSGVQLWDGTTIDDEVFIGPNATFTNDLTPRSKNRNWVKKCSHIQKGASIGANATLLPVTVGRYAMVAAGAVVTRDVPPHALVIGSPARISGWVCQCGSKLEFDHTSQSNCKSCGLKFKINTEKREVKPI